MKCINSYRIHDRASFSINRSDTYVSRSKQLDRAIPAFKITTLSSDEFVGMVADNPDYKIELKASKASIQNNHDAIRKEQEENKPLPVVRQVGNAMVQRN